MPTKKQMEFKAELRKFGKMGEKTGWTYIDLSSELAQQLMPNNKKSFRVKGTLDKTKIKQVSLVPMGEGDFIMAINATMRKGLKKIVGESIIVKIEVDTEERKLPEDLILCLKEEPKAFAAFDKQPESHKHHYARWINEAKTDPTRVKRIARVVNGFLIGQTFAEMLKAKD